MNNYLGILFNISRFVEDFKNDTLQNFFEDSAEAERNYYFTPRYSSYWQILRDIVAVCDVLEMEKLQVNKDRISTVLDNLRALGASRHKLFFEQSVGMLKTDFQEIEFEAKEKISLLEENERISARAHIHPPRKDALRRS